MNARRRTLHLAAILTSCIFALAAPMKGRAEVEPASWAAAPTAIVDTPRLYVLSFSNAAIDDVAGAVLGTSLGLAFDFDPALQGEMSLHVEGRMTRDQLMDAFSQSLTEAGGAIVHDGSRIRLMPTAKARRLEQMEKRSRGLMRGFSEEQAAAVHLAASRNDASLSAPLGSSGPSLPLGWVALSALAGGAIALAVSGVLSRLTFGRVPPVTGKRGAVIDRLMASDPIEAEVLADARRLSAESRQPLEQTLNRMGRISDDALAKAYSAVTGCAIWQPSERPALTGHALLGPTPDYLRVRGLVPISLEPKRLVLAALDPLDDEAIAAVAATTARPVTILVGAAADVRGALQLH